MSVKAALLELASVLAPELPKVKAQIEAACDRPEAYIASFTTRLGERAITAFVVSTRSILTA